MCDICDICKQKHYDVNTPIYGKLISEEDIQVHYYCLLSGNEIPQRGN